METQTGGGSGGSGNPGGGGGGSKKHAIHWGGVDFFWNNPLYVLTCTVEH